MSRRRKPPGTVRVRQGKKLIDALFDGVSKRDAIDKAGIPRELGAFGGFKSDRQVERMLNDPDTRRYLLDKLRRTVRSWVELEEMARAVLSRQHEGLTAQGTPIIAEEPIEVEKLQQKAALGVLALLAKTSPESFVARAVKEDQAKRSLPELAHAIVGPETPIIEIPAEVVPPPPDGTPHA